MSPFRSVVLPEKKKLFSQTFLVADIFSASVFPYLLLLRSMSMRPMKNYVSNSDLGEPIGHTERLYCLCAFAHAGL